MRFSSRSKVSVLVSLATIAVLVAGFVAYSVLGSKTHALAASGSATYAGTLTTASAKGTANPTQLPGKVPPTGKFRGDTDFRGRPHSTNAAALNAALSHPSAVSSNRAAGTTINNFDGINATQSAAVNGFDVEPPDEALAVGPGYVFNMVNLAGAIYLPNGQLAAGPFSVNTFFGEPATAFLSDPRLYYDNSTHTWFAAMLELGTTTSHFDIAVNPNQNPLSTWTVYQVDTTDLNNAGCPCFGDYPQFGIDQYNVYISTNEFSISGPQYNGAQIYVISKSQLESLAKSINVVQFGNLSVAGVISYHVQPAITIGSASAEYFMSSLDPNNTFDDRLAVWAMTARDQVAQGVVPNLSATVISSEAYAMPPNAQTPAGFNPGTKAPTTGIVQSDFDAMQEVEYIKGHLYGALNTSVNIPGDTGARGGIAWFNVIPSISGGVVSSKTHVSKQGYVAEQGLYLLYPHIEVSTSGTAAIVFSYGGLGTYLSVGYVVRSAGSSSFGPIHTAASGAAPDNGFGGTAASGGAARWGDYSAGQLNPSGHGIWFATQYIAGSGDQFENWSDRVFEITG